MQRYFRVDDGEGKVSHEAVNVLEMPDLEYSSSLESDRLFALCGFEKSMRRQEMTENVTYQHPSTDSERLRAIEACVEKWPRSQKSKCGPT